MTARWTGRADPLMVEVAEALGVTSDLVMAVRPEPGNRSYIALYTPVYDDANEGELPEVFAAYLRRRSDQILEVVRTELQPGMLERIKREMGA